LKVEKPHLGWREWVYLPELGIGPVKAKVDTGARTSSLHAEDLRPVRRGGKPWLRFRVHPRQRSKAIVVDALAPVVDERTVRSSSGATELRPVILTTVDIGRELWEIELTLTNRDIMGFRMLLGRQAIRSHFVVDPGRSFLTRKVKMIRRSAAGDARRKGR